MTGHGHLLPRPFRFISITYFVAGIVTAVILWVRWSPQVSVQILLLGVSVVVLENFAVSLPGYGLSLAYPLAFAAVLLCGPTEGAIIATLSMVNVADLRRGRSLAVHAFNLGQQLICMGAAGSVYILLGGRVMLGAAGGPSGLVSTDFPRLLLPLAVSALVAASANVLLVATGYAARERKRLASVLASVKWVWSAQVAMASIGVLIAQVMASSVAALPLFVFPLLVARQLFQRYNALNDAYYDTIRTLVAAMEAKDPYTKGHSERVVMYALRLAEEIGLPESERTDIARAALLHDIGKLTVPGEVLRKREPLTEAEWLDIREHPGRGAAMVARIPALRSLAPVVAQHHERVDGHGYPSGTEQLHTFARVLAIADSFDAMTSDRPYRAGMSEGDALQELRRSAGKQFDQEMVEAFVTATVARTGTSVAAPEPDFTALGLEGGVV